ncbi:efflux RND transporter permease subunit [Candidatus Entotheonella palauensis]|uniref:efflux RND transporter permease subunit n=1 Tax=Candidatus Entotheonella palauensis TaxID=93172 RepID=UPI000B7FFEA3|nr:efflux RND transporter permease subunit [Candidatus Entotheonella palauensis]
MRITQIAIARPVSTIMAAVALLLFGVLGFQRLPIHLLPDLSYPTLTIRTELTEAAPAEVETLLSKPIEEVVGVVSNVVRVSSASRAGQSDVLLEFSWDTNVDLVALEVRERLDRLALPTDAEAPILLRYDPALDPIMRLSLSSTTDLTALRTLADDTIKRELEVVEGVAAVEVSGGFEEEIQVDVDEERLARLGISLPQVVERLKQENIDLAGGTIQDGDARYLVRTLNAFATVADIGDIVVGRRASRNGASRHNTSILLRDVADVRRGHKDRRLLTRINGREAIELAVFKRMDANTVRVSERVRERLKRVGENLRRRQQPAHIQIVSEQAAFIQQAIQEVLTTAAIGGILAMLVLYIFLRDMRSTLIIGSAIPISIIGSFFLMYLFRLSLNIMSLGGLALGIGMLVDNAIVVLESIDRQRASGLSRAQAALRGTMEVGQAITASTLTTICVFIPLIFVQGVAGQLFNNLALTVSFSLLASLAVAVTLIPMMAALAGDAPVVDDEDAPEDLVEGFVDQVRGFQLLFRLFGLLAFPFVWILGWLITRFERVFNRLSTAYLAVLRTALRRRWLTGLVAILACGAVAYLGQFIPYEFMPELYQGELIADVTLATGTPLETTAEKIGRLERLAVKQPHVLRVYSSIGRRQQSGAAISEERENVAQMRLILEPDARPADEETLLANLRQAFQQVAGVEVQFARPAYFSFELPLEVEIRGHDLGKLQSAAQQVAERLAQLLGLTDIRSSMAPGEPELQITFDRQKLATLNLDVAEVATLIQHNVQGEIATELKQPERDIDIRVRTHPAQMQGIGAVEHLQVNPDDAVSVPLNAVARLVVARGPSEIRREDLRRVAVISANIQDRALGQTIRDVQQTLGTLALPAGLVAEVRGQSTEMVTAFQSLVFALALATFLVYLVLASQFESFLQPFIILFAIPLGFGGVVLALWLTGQALNVMVAIGAVLLVGIVVNNAIVLIDYANQCRQLDDRLNPLSAVQEAAAVRFRPIVMTTATTVLGLLPMALGLGHGAELRTPLAITVIGGLLVATLLTLFVIPLAYSLIGGGRRRGHQLGNPAVDTSASTDDRSGLTSPATPVTKPPEAEPPPADHTFVLPPSLRQSLPADVTTDDHQHLSGGHGVVLQYLAKRLALAIPALFLVTLMVFTLVRLIPGDVVEMMYEEQGYADDIDEMRELLGLHQPLHLQYLNWLKQVLRGDLGVSLWTENDVTTELWSRLPVTLELGIMAIIFAILLAIPLGIVAATYPDTVIDHMTRSIAIGGLAIPGFWIATMVITLPAYYFGWTPPIQYIRFTDSPLGHIGQFMIPAVILGLASAATVMRLTRAMMLEVLRQDYVRTAWSKGLNDEIVILKHALRNALIPVMTILGIQLAQIAGSTVIIESIFNLPGIGKFLLDAITQRDYPVVQGINLCLAVLVVGLNLAVDLVYAIIDPRIRYQ